MCEVFKNNKCLGCVGLDPQYNIDVLKFKCETYKEEMINKDKRRNISKNTKSKM